MVLCRESRQLAYVEAIAWTGTLLWRLQPIGVAAVFLGSNKCSTRLQSATSTPTSKLSTARERLCELRLDFAGGKQGHRSTRKSGGGGSGLDRSPIEYPLFGPLSVPLEASPLKSSYGLGKRWKLSQHGLDWGHSLIQIWCIFALKCDIW